MPAANFWLGGDAAPLPSNTVDASNICQMTQASYLFLGLRSTGAQGCSLDKVYIAGHICKLCERWLQVSNTILHSNPADSRIGHCCSTVYISEHAQHLDFWQQAGPVQDLAANDDSCKYTTLVRMQAYMTKAALLNLVLLQQHASSSWCS